MSGNQQPPTRSDRRAARTRKAIVEAYNQLFLERRQHQIKVADIVAQADVGRSTFYEHFTSADAVFFETFSKPLGILARAAAGQGDHDQMVSLLRHFWDNRQRARELLAGRQGERVARLLADLVAGQLPEDAGMTLPRRLAAVQLADAALGPMRAWLLAEAPCAVEDLARAVVASGSALRQTLEQPQAPNTAFT